MTQQKEETSVKHDSAKRVHHHETSLTDCWWLLITVTQWSSSVSYYVVCYVNIVTDNKYLRARSQVMLLYFVFCSICDCRPSLFFCTKIFINKLICNSMNREDYCVKHNSDFIKQRASLCKLTFPKHNASHFKLSLWGELMLQLRVETSEQNTTYTSSNRGLH